MDRVRAFGLAASGGVAVVAVMVCAIGSSSGGTYSPPDSVPRGVVLALLFSVPGVIGLVGVRRRDRALLVAAAVASLVPSALSVATLPLVIPAILFIVSAADATASTRRPTWLVATAIVALGIGSLVGLLATTETRCWLAYNTPNGVVTRDATERDVEGPLGGPGGPFAGGCDGGALTVRGAGLALVLAIGSAVLAFAAPRPGPEGPPVGTAA
jgi:hypothetical protein